MKLCYSTKFDSDDRDMTDIVCLHTAGEIKIYIGHCSPDAIETCHNKYGEKLMKYQTIKNSNKSIHDMKFNPV
jgi:hypothetical protein